MNEMSTKSIDELQTMLQEALENEDYELASHIRDEIKKRQ
jgi:protein-arginine kinase activator protein McsA